MAQASHVRRRAEMLASLSLITSSRRWQTLGLKRFREARAKIIKITLHAVFGYATHHHTLKRL